MYASSTEFVTVQVTSSEPITDAATVEVAFTEGSEPTAWTAADWSATDATHGKAKVLVGPSTPHVLTKGAWTVWFRLVDTPETIVRSAGILHVQ